METQSARLPCHGNSSFALNLTQERIPRPKNCPRLFRPSANHQGLQMARYFFHIDDGCTILDDQGLDLPSLEAARLEAVMACGEMLRDIPNAVRKGDPGCG